MKFNDLDTKMRVYETSHDYNVLPGMYMIARLDGKGFTKLTKDKYTKPFDNVFSSYMKTTLKETVLNHGFSFIYAYTQSDEISLLFNLEENTFNRKLRKLNSTLAGIASAEFTFISGHKGSFDCRICQLPNIELVQDYFSWRQEDAYRNCLNAYCYWTLRHNDFSAGKATSLMNGLTNGKKLELLFSYGVNFQQIKDWHKRGTEFYYKTIMKEGWNPLLKETTLVLRKQFIEEEIACHGEQQRLKLKQLIKSYE